MQHFRRNDIALRLEPQHSRKGARFRADQARRWVLFVYFSRSACQEFFTRFGSAEFAVRPFLDRDPQRALAYVLKWAESADPHMRRLASEGYRPLPSRFREPAIPQTNSERQ